MKKSDGASSCSSRQATAAHLKAHQFRKGRSGNLRGRDWRGKYVAIFKRLASRRVKRMTMNGLRMLQQYVTNEANIRGGDCFSATFAGVGYASALAWQLLRRPRAR